jgi:hypothetical protein
VEVTIPSLRLKTSLARLFSGTRPAARWTVGPGLTVATTPKSVPINTDETTKPAARRHECGWQT